MSHFPLKDNGLSHELAQQIRTRGLGPFALLVLEAGRPLALLTSQLLWLAQPVLNVAWNSQSLAKWAQFLEEPGSVDRLMEQLQSEE